MIKNIFNIILLSLIFTTIAITIISYVIFRIRQLAFSKSSKGVFFLDGVYFSRFSPKLREMNETNFSQNEKPQHFKIKFAIIATLTFLSVTFIFLLENHLTYRQEILSRMERATKFQQLSKNGLLQEHQFSSEDRITQVNVTLTPLLQSFQETTLKRISKKKIYLFAGSPTNKLQQWKDLFIRHQLHFREIKSLSNLNATSLIIIPDTSALSKKDFKKMQKKIKEGRAIILAGKKPWKEKRIGTSSQQCKHLAFPCYSVGSNTSWVNISSHEKNELRDYQLLTLLDYHINDFVLQSHLIDSDRISLFFVRDYVTAEDTIKDILESSSVPITLINKNNYFRNEDIQSGNHYAIDGNPYIHSDKTTRSIFSTIQQTRLMLEELSERKVSGVFFSNSRPGINIYDAITQNKLLYAFTPDDYFSAPTHVNDRLWKMPYSNINDTEILNRRDITSVDQAIKTLITQIKDDSKRSIFPKNIVLHQDLYNSKFAQNFLDKLLSNRFLQKNSTQFDDILLKQNAIHQLQITYKIEEGKNLHLNIFNPHNEILHDTSLEFISPKYHLLGRSKSVIAIDQLIPGTNDITVSLQKIPSPPHDATRLFPN